MSTTTSAIFTGSSQFSNDFQQVIQRAVSMASLPMQQTQSDEANLQSQSSELTNLSAKFSALQSAITGLNSALGLGSYSANASTSVPGTTIATVGLSGAPGVGTYTVEVDGLGSYATAMSSDGTSVTDPAKSSISDATAYTLSVGGVSSTIRPTGTSLSALADAINRSAAGIAATVVNVGTTAAPDYRLSLQNSKLANSAIQLTSVDGSHPGTALLEQQAPGAATTYRVNGKPTLTPLSSDSPSITLAPGVKVTMLAAGSSTITISRNTSAVSTALSNLVTAYNAAQTEVNANRGQSKGALQGQSILMNLTSTLSQIANYSTGTSGISSLTSLGLSFDSNGVMSFDSTAFATATAGQVQQLSDFLGSTSTGGLLKMANDALTGATDSKTGLLQTGISALQDRITRDNDLISTQQDRVTALQNQLNRQMAAADSAIATMEQQYSYLSEMMAQTRVNAQNGG